MPVAVPPTVVVKLKVVFVVPEVGETVRPAERVDGGNAKLACTVLLVDIVTEQLPVPLHDPDHPVNTYPEAAVFVTLTTVPEL